MARRLLLLIELLIPPTLIHELSALRGHPSFLTLLDVRAATLPDPSFLIKLLSLLIVVDEVPILVGAAHLVSKGCLHNASCDPMQSLPKAIHKGVS